jgi:protocatechuate 3,4-dioxygenase beta subunit
MRACRSIHVRKQRKKESIMKILFALASISLSAFIVCHSSYAAQMTVPPETSKSDHCEATPAVGAIHYPGAATIPHTNDLVRPTGKADNAEGQIVYLMGKVLDTNCNPLSDVVVELWQPDPYSQFIIPTKGDMASPQSMFAGAGKTYTGIDGTFSFRTLFPGTLRICVKRDNKGRCIKSIERAPFFNIRIAGKVLRTTVSMATFFENDRRNPTDPVYSKLSQSAQQLITMKVLPSKEGDYNSGMRTYLEFVVPAKQHFHGY